MKDDVCCFCGLCFVPYQVPDRDVTGRVAHFRCSEKEFEAGTWKMKEIPGEPYEEGDDGRAWDHINNSTWQQRGQS